MGNTSFSRWLLSSLLFPRCVSGLVAGKSKTGKTTLLGFVRNMYPGPCLHLSPRATDRDVSEILRKLEKRGDSRQLTISTSNAAAVRTLLDDLFEHRSRPKSGLFLAVDEAHRFLSDRDNDVFKLAFMEGRHYGLTSWYASQKVQALPSTLATNADVCCVGYLPGVSDANYWHSVGMETAPEPFVFNLYGHEVEDLAVEVFASGKIRERAQH